MILKVILRFLYRVEKIKKTQMKMESRNPKLAWVGIKDLSLSVVIQCEPPFGTGTLNTMIFCLPPSLSAPEFAFFEPPTLALFALLWTGRTLCLVQFLICSTFPNVSHGGMGRDTYLNRVKVNSVNI
ncbi:hypothetical protein NPIL_316541 [Nephila pilipes]|uniref:Uncharacterized protein n=1 Tax=Nephila pilipes TaxID=299642 RepID=A0A8X6QMH5_NEPPI|nr:hypothetical protein NPIL_316541 [Nephila pilipes]